MFDLFVAKYISPTSLLKLELCSESIVYFPYERSRSVHTFTHALSWRTHDSRFIHFKNYNFHIHQISKLTRNSQFRNSCFKNFNICNLETKSIFSITALVKWRNKQLLIVTFIEGSYNITYRSPMTVISYILDIELLLNSLINKPWKRVHSLTFPLKQLLDMFHFAKWEISFMNDQALLSLYIPKHSRTRISKIFIPSWKIWDATEYNLLRRNEKHYCYKWVSQTFVSWGGSMGYFIFISYKSGSRRIVKERKNFLRRSERTNSILAIKGICNIFFNGSIEITLYYMKPLNNCQQWECLRPARMLSTSILVHLDGNLNIWNTLANSGEKRN